MPSPSHGEEATAEGGPDLVTFSEMPDRLETAGLPRISPQRCRQLAETDPDWPIPMDKAQRIGRRMRAFDWRVLEPYFRNRKRRQGQRTDIKSRREAPPGDHESDERSDAHPEE
jgi:hypothetical protein